MRRMLSVCAAACRRCAERVSKARRHARTLPYLRRKLPPLHGGLSGGGARHGALGAFERSMPSDLIRGWAPVRIAIELAQIGELICGRKRIENKSLEPGSIHRPIRHPGRAGRSIENQPSRQNTLNWKTCREPQAVRRAAGCGPAGTRGRASTRGSRRHSANGRPLHFPVHPARK